MFLRYIVIVTGGGRRKDFILFFFVHHQQHSNVSFVHVREVFFAEVQGFCGLFCCTGVGKLSVSNSSLQALFQPQSTEGLVVFVKHAV